MRDLIERAGALAARAVRARRRVVLGLTGPPGAGKSTLAEALVAGLGPAVAAYLPMDGFHLADALLRNLGIRDRKGAPDTFDADGYAHLLARVREATETVYAPRFDRAREDPVAGALRIAPAVPLVITEGNYLLLWPPVRAQLDEVWYLDPPQDERIARLAARHEQFGKSPAEAAWWAGCIDEANAQQIARTRDDADLVLARWTAPSGHR